MVKLKLILVLPLYPLLIFGVDSSFGIVFFDCLFPWVEYSAAESL